MKAQKVNFQSIDAYIASFPEKVQEIMHQLRATIKAAAPKAGEKISYNMPTFTLNGSNLVYFAGWKNHIAFYGAPRGNPDFQEDLSPFETGKGTLQFPYNRPVPFDLVTKIVQFRVGEIRRKTEKQE